MPQDSSGSTPLPPTTRARLGLARAVRRAQFAWFRLRGRRVAWVDCGANCGSVLERQIRWFPSREYHAFEANPALLPQLHAVAQRHPRTRVDLHHRAVWIEDGSLPFFLSGDSPSGRPDTEGSTLLAGKTPRNEACGAIDYTQPVEVPSLDFSAWIRATFAPGDCVWLKMDIEGAEYEVLDRMLADGSIDLIDKAFVEFHHGLGHAIPDVDDARHRRIIDAVSRRTRLVVWY